MVLKNATVSLRSREEIRLPQLISRNQELYEEDVRSDLEILVSLLHRGSNRAESDQCQSIPIRRDKAKEADE